MWGKKRANRDECRDRMHRLREYPQIDRIQNIRKVCAEYRIPFEEIGTTHDELIFLQRAASLRMAKEEMRSMRADTHDAKSSLTKIIDLLTDACRPYDWAAIGTTWQELGRLHRAGLLRMARVRYQQMLNKELVRGDRITPGQIEELLTLAGGTIEDLGDQLSDTAWEELKKA